MLKQENAVVLVGKIETSKLQFREWWKTNQSEETIDSENYQVQEALWTCDNLYEDFLGDYENSLTDLGKQEVHTILSEGAGAEAIWQFLGGLDQAREFVQKVGEPTFKPIWDKLEAFIQNNANGGAED